MGDRSLKNYVMLARDGQRSGHKAAAEKREGNENRRKVYEKKISGHNVCGLDGNVFFRVWRSGTAC